MVIQQSFPADETLKDYLTDRIKEYNNGHSPAHRAIRVEGAVTPASFVVRDETGTIVAGLWAESFWRWFEVDKLWVREDHRKTGWGTRLMDAAEDEARRRQCRFVFLTTFGFQAPEFYKRRGFRVLGAREDYPPGTTYYWLQKDL